MLQCDPDEFDESDFDDFDDDVEPSLREDLIFSSNVVESQLVDSGSPFVEPQTENQNHKSGPAEDFFDLPALCKEIYRQKGIIAPYDWQLDCLSTPGVLEGQQNLVYSLPTSAGKSFVGDILLLRSLLAREKKGLLILPYVSLVTEKTNFLLEFGRRLKFRVMAFSGSASTSNIPTGPTLMVCTIEKAASIINSLSQEGRLREVGTIVVDELHLVGESSRGSILEMTLTRAMEFNSEIQIVGMSATIPNLGEIALWLSAVSKSFEFRPHGLKEFIKVNKSCIAKGHSTDAGFESTNISAEWFDKDDPNDLLFLCIGEPGQVIIFCPTKAETETTAVLLATRFRKEMSSLGSRIASPSWVPTEKEKCLIRFALGQEEGGTNESSEEMRSSVQLLIESKVVCDREASAARSELLSRLAECNNENPSTKMKVTLPWGICFHHSGLNRSEREVVESGYMSGAIRILTATSTLAAGVNLPARRVLVFPYIVKDFIAVGRYRQMAGRAGRTGFGHEGTCFIILKNAADLEKAKNLFGALPERVESQLQLQSTDFKRVVLNAVVACTDFEARNSGDGQSKYCGLSESRILQFLQRTLLGVQQPGHAQEEIQKQLRLMADLPEPFVKLESRMWFVTQLGMAASKSFFSMEESSFLFLELQKARGRLFLSTNLHLVFLQTPLKVLASLGHEDMMNFSWQKIIEEGDKREDVKFLLASNGLDAAYLDRKSCGMGHEKKEMFGLGRRELSARRVWGALILDRVVNESPLQTICLEFGIEKGKLNELVSEAIMFSSQLLLFCQNLEMDNLGALFEHLDFSNRLGDGVSKDLVPLMQISGIGKYRARDLWKNGFKTVEQVAAADVETMEKRLGPAAFRHITPQKIIQNAKRVLKDQTLELTFRTRELKKLTQGRGKDKKAKGAAGGRQKKKANAADSKVAVSAAKRFRPTGSMHAVNPIGNEFEQTYSAIEIANSQQGFGSPTTVITSSNLEATAVIKPTPATPSDSNFADYFISQMLSAPCR